MTAAPRAKKSLGQHFLKDAKTSARIVDLLRIGPEDRVLEIGPGPGAITGIIHERGPSEFRLIEKDSYWAAHHAELERPAPAVQVLNADALAFPWESLEGPWKIISNLPYNVGSPLMWDIVSRTPDLTRAVFMVQKEVAERLYAKPGTKDYGLDPELCPGRVGLCGRARCVQSASEGGFRRGHVHPPASGTASRGPEGPFLHTEALFPVAAQAAAIDPPACGQGRHRRRARAAGDRPGSASRDAHAGTVSTACRNFWTFGVLTSPKKHD